MRIRGRSGLLPFALWLIVATAAPAAFGQADRQQALTFTSHLVSLLPKTDLWQPSEHPRQFLPETLYEYIDGAAESFIAYNFQELLVGQYVQKGSPSSALTLEIYDMGDSRNAFGIYGAERYPESRFIPTGVQGYYEDGSLNFLAGRYYVKMMCYECGPEAEKLLTGLAVDIASRIPDRAGFPPILSAFPRPGLVANSEKFILRNFQGLSFLGNGYQASYKVEGLEFECFIVENSDPSRAEAVARQYLENFRKAGAAVQETPGGGWTFRDKYLLHVFVTREGRYLCGVSRIPDGRVDTGRTYLGLLVKGLQGMAQPSAGRAGR